jgi:hypothetical protein
MVKSRATSRADAARESDFMVVGRDTLLTLSPMFGKSLPNVSHCHQFSWADRDPSRCCNAGESYGKVPALDTGTINHPGGFLSAHNLTGGRPKSRTPGHRPVNAKVKSRTPDQLKGCQKQPPIGSHRYDVGNGGSYEVVV